MSTRQQVLVLYLASSALDGAVVGWARYDGDQPDAATQAEAQACLRAIVAAYGPGAAANAPVAAQGLPA